MCTYFDVMVSGLFTVSNTTINLKALYERNEIEKLGQYQDRARETEHVSFEPQVFLATGGTGPRCIKTLKRMAA